MARRWTGEREKCFVPDDLDLRREREYLERHPAPRDIDDYVENITTVRSQEEIEHRNKLIQEIRASNGQFEHLNLTAINYNTLTFGGVFSNILMSYLLEYRVKVPEIDFKVYHQIPIEYFWIALKSEDDIDLSADVKKLHVYTLKIFTNQWLFQSKFKEYIDAWRSKSLGISYPQPSDPVDSDHVLIKPGVLVTRRCAILKLKLNNKGKLDGHEIFMFWQIHMERDDFIIEYGICDNLKIHSFYQPSKGMNFNFHDVIREAFREYLDDNHVVYSKIKFIFIENRLPGTIDDQLHYNNMEYTCMTTTRRAILYFAIFYDIFKLDYNDDFEHEIHHSALQDGTDLTQKEILFLRNYMGYTHYMNKMMDWVLSSPLLWPEYDPSLPDALQARPTRERPLCIVLFPVGFKYQFPCMFLGENELNLNKVDFWTELEGKSGFDTTYISIYNFFEECSTQYFFHMDGGEVFRPAPELPSDDGGHCVVSAAADIGDFSSVLSALHKRLAILELSAV